MHMRHWMRHTAMVPKGFIRYQVLESLSEKPMSGSEIMDKIEKRTSGRWKPSPGSIYPLLAWLQDNGYVNVLESHEGGMKRYELSEKGKALYEEEKKIKRNFRREAKMFPPPFLGALWFRIPPEKTAEVRESIRRVVGAFFELGSTLEVNFSEKAVDEASKVLNETADRIGNINRELRAKKSER